jgi:hypothetical protein
VFSVAGFAAVKPAPFGCVMLIGTGMVAAAVDQRGSKLQIVLRNQCNRDVPPVKLSQLQRNNGIRSPCGPANFATFNLSGRGAV